jgi:serine/threonine protein kinase/Tol biopolymer transport system component
MERLRQVEEIFQAALQRDPAERDAYVREACRGDAGLQREVASLLANHHEATESKPWAAAAAAQLIGGPTSLKAGQRLGPYEVLTPIGKGGMGEVYKARDTRLKRDVAIKICAAQFSERFDREARVIASLNHPNICQLYDVGPNYLVMELVEGANLSGPLPLETALNHARQIADALEAAHEKGIVHRDLKTANVKITPAGVLKVLDFGLAKAAEEPSTTDPCNVTTLTMSPTRVGMILGTAPYMSPEQARGVAVDKRADIWAFGCVLYEMITGKQAFHGETTSDILAAVLKEEPDWNRIPARVQPLLKRCLVKDPKHRLRDIGDAMALLDRAPEVAPARLLWPWVAAAAVLAVGFAALSFVHLRDTPAETRLISTSIMPPEKTEFDFAGRYNPPALSPDGRRIVFGVRGADGKTQLWMRPLDSPAAQPLAGTEGAALPFWSPNNRSIAFFADGKLKRIDVAGGPALTLTDAPNPYGGSWSPQDVIVYAEGNGPLQQMAAGGGAPKPATTLKLAHDYAHRFPWFLPDGRHFLFTGQVQANSSDATLRIGALDSQEVKTIGPASFNTMYANGYLLYLRWNTLMAQPFDEKRLATTGEAAPIAEQVRTRFGGAVTVGLFSISPEGLLAYQAGSAGSEQLTWFDRGGKPVGTLGDAGDFWSVDFSPDRKSVAVTRLDQNQDIWLYDTARGLATRFTFSPAAERNPMWSPDGRWIVYDSLANGQNELYRKAVDGTGSAELLPAIGSPASWSPDGKFLLYAHVDPKMMVDTWVLPFGVPSGVPSKPFRWWDTPFRKSLAKFSPNGCWVAYQSNESGRTEIYVAPFPGPGGKRQISIGGGLFARWRSDGREIFYLANSTLMAVEVSIKDGSIQVGAIRSLHIPVTWPHYKYDASADGQRFLVATPREQKSSAPLTLVQNWKALLKKK